MCVQVVPSVSVATAELPRQSVPTRVAVKTSSSVQHRYGASVSTVQGDMTQMDVDAIVNAANDRLQHGAGLAKDIVVKGVLSSSCYMMIIRTVININMNISECR